MITVSHIRAASYAIGKRLQGYHLLENPKGVSQTEVNMIKDKYHWTSYGDDFFETMRIKKIFSKDGNHTVKKLLMSTHYMDTNTMQMTKPRKKDIAYIEAHDADIWSDGAIIAEKNNFNKKLAKRNEVPENKYDKMVKEKMEAQLGRRYYKTHTPRWHRILALGLYDKLGGRPAEKRPNFFKVLYKNLTNKV